MSDAVSERQTCGTADDHPRDREPNITTTDPRAHRPGNSERD
jgi:hypothetical protein